MSPYRVFISSIMNKATEDLWPERMATKAAVERFRPIAEAWAFEDEPASSKPLLDFYIDAVKTSDLLVLIVGGEMTDPVHQEFLTARDHGKPILLFVKSVDQRSAAAEEIILLAEKKYDQFSNATELSGLVQRSIGTEILSVLRGSEGTKSSSSGQLARLRKLQREGRGVVIVPRFPGSSNPSCSIREFGPTAVIFEVAGCVEVRIPNERIEEVLDSGPNDLPEVHIRGRLQQLTFQQTWKFFTEPPSSGLLPIGVGIPTEQ